jgi:hypothetical protein
MGRAVVASATQGGHKARAGGTAREVDRWVRSRAGSLRPADTSNRNVVAQIHLSPGLKTAPTHANTSGNSISIVETTDVWTRRKTRDLLGEGRRVGKGGPVERLDLFSGVTCPDLDTHSQPVSDFLVYRNCGPFRDLKCNG